MLICCHVDQGKLYFYQGNYIWVRENYILVREKLGNVSSLYEPWICTELLLHDL